MTDLAQGGVVQQQQQQQLSQKRATLLSQKSLQFDDPIASNHEIERIISKIQQDNKILAELDKNAGESRTRTSCQFFFSYSLLSRQILSRSALSCSVSLFTTCFIVPCYKL